MQLFADEWGAGESDLDGVAVGLLQVGEEAAARVVAAVHFVEEVDALDVEVVVLGRGDIGIVLELLDVDDGDLGLAAVVAGSDIGLDVAGKRFAAVDDVDGQAAHAEFVAGLPEQIQPVNDEAEGR